ncbi:MAG: hypothetical protein JW936_02925 [Sedimentisphaerales bacterium]|nr:hypothetical protein [Sedimentisphaerales bacterium]
MNSPQTQADYLALFDAAFKPGVTGEQRTSLRFEISRGPAALLDAVAERPAQTNALLANPQMPQLWGDWQNIPNLDFSQTVLLGILLARRNEHLLKRTDVALPAALLWYKSALASTIIDPNNTIDILSQAESVLTPAVQAITAPQAGLLLTFTYSLQAIYENQTTRPLPQLKKKHSNILRNVIWPQLSILRPQQALTLIFDSFIATKNIDVLSAGFIQLLSSSSDENIPYLGHALSPNTLNWIIDLTRISQRTITDRAADNLHLLVKNVAASASCTTEEQRHELITNALDFAIGAANNN